MARPAPIADSSEVEELFNSDDARWDTVLTQAFPDYDIYHSRHYLRLYESETIKGYGYRFCIGQSNFFLPFLKIPVPASNNENYVLESPYGYAGPLCNVGDPVFVQLAWQRLIQALNRQEIIAGLIRFNPFFDPSAVCASTCCEPEYQRPVVVLDTCLSETDILSQYRKDVRNKINKAEKQGVTVRNSDADCDWSAFAKGYRQAMVDKNANDFYIFDDEYFDQLRTNLSGHWQLLIAEQGGKVSGGALLLSQGPRMHYHLSFVNDIGRQNGSANVLRHAAVKQAKLHGFEIINFGGGTSNKQDDSLLRFKQGFSKQTLDFYIGKLTVNAERLREANHQWELNNPHKRDKFQQFHLKCLQ